MLTFSQYKNVKFNVWCVDSPSAALLTRTGPFTGSPTAR